MHEIILGLTEIKIEMIKIISAKAEILTERTEIIDLIEIISEISEKNTGIMSARLKY